MDETSRNRRVGRLLLLFSGSRTFTTTNKTFQCVRSLHVNGFVTWRKPGAIRLTSPVPSRPLCTTNGDGPRFSVREPRCGFYDRKEALAFFVLISAPPSLIAPEHAWARYSPKIPPGTNSSHGNASKLTRTRHENHPFARLTPQFPLPPVSMLGLSLEIVICVCNVQLFVVPFNRSVALLISSAE